MHNCDYFEIKGRLRDVPGVGLKKCSICGTVTHQEDLRSSVNYESSTMHNWASGWGDLSGPGSDIQRRIGSITSVIDKDLEREFSLLDFGCGDGGFLAAFPHMRNVSLSGFDPEKVAYSDIKNKRPDIIF